MSQPNQNFDNPNTRDPAEGHDPEDKSLPKPRGVNTRDPAEGADDETRSPDGAQKSSSDPKHPENPL